MTSVSSSPNGANKPWFCTNERLRWEFFSQGQKGAVHSRADENNKPQETYQILEDLTTARNKKTIKTTNMKRRITRKQKSQNTKTEKDSEANSVRMQIDKDEQYIEQENIQLEEDHIMEDESLEPEPLLHDSPELIMDSLDLEEIKEAPRKDTKKSKDASNSEEESQCPEESNEKLDALKSEDDDDIDEGIATRKLTRSTRRLRVIIAPKKPQTRKSQRKTTKGSKDWEPEHDFKGRDIVFVDPLDDKAEFWWPAMIVPNDEIDESMDVDGKLEENLLAGKFLVRYFEDMTYSVVEYKGLKHFVPDAEPFLTFKNTCDKFSSHIGVRRALTCKMKGEPNKAFKWDYWKRPLGENQEPTPVTLTTLSTKRRASTSKGGSKSNYKTSEIEKNKSPIRRNSSSTKSRSSITNSGNHSSQASQEGEPSEEENTIDICIGSPPSLGRRRKSETENIDSQDSQNFQTNTNITKDNMEMENVEINKSPKRRRSSLTDKSDDGEQNSNSRNRKIKRVSAGESMDEEPTILSPTTPNTTSTMVETSVEMPMDTAETIIETSTEKNNEPLIEIMEEDNVPSATSLTSPLIIEKLSEAAQTNIARFKFDDPTLDSETREKMYDDAEEELRSLMKEWRALNRNLRKMEKELMSKRARKLRNNEELGDDDIDTEDEGDTSGHVENGVELVDSSENENNNEDGEERENEEGIQVITRSRKMNEESKVSKSKRTLKKI
ncbi:hypothetical protein RclHR1_10620003 [Rhizophagus clarus]|uniref:PWWP domain-containing protein n=1 Tax=Rhizophagus clarus TaxID=94130 RepID=A0A2Z6QTE2_9GLOM|nr:hypothetical protein RclHR1_10620003 [Rhizophagus clarus]GES81237.1 hypothetical protein GLOIN_2v1762582 [Rhizophagus clarus]